MEILLTVLCWAFQLGILAGAAAIVPLILRRRWRDRRKTEGRLWAIFAGMLALILTGALYWSFHPIWYCREELQPYVSEGEKQDCLSFGGGIYSKRIPAFAAFVTVDDANEEEIVFTTAYLFIPLRVTRSLKADGAALLTFYT